LNWRISIQNRQRTAPVDRTRLRRFALSMLGELFPKEAMDLGLYLVEPAEMAGLNQSLLGHEGSTDVITLDYGMGPGLRASDRPLRYAELILCVDEARRQARRFGVTWHEELARYLVHGGLHLRGFDDATPGARRRMKREEDWVLRQLGPVFRFGR
jgi:rRNA maturation RNase YbeY